MMCYHCGFDIKENSEQCIFPHGKERKNNMNENPKTLNEWCEAAYENAKSKGWYDDGERNIGEAIALIHSELSEALEEIRNGKDVKEIYLKDGKLEGFSIEMADVLIRIFDLCGSLNIDLQSAVEKKHAYNKTRPIKHGGKKF